LNLAGPPLTRPLHSLRPLWHHPTTCFSGARDGSEGRGVDWEPGKLHSTSDNWRRVSFEASYLSCYQPNAKDITGPRSSFNHQQTPERKDFTPVCVMSADSALHHFAQMNLKETAKAT